MKIKENGNNGSEIHRLKPMQENYDKETFDRMYKICKPVIRRLTKQIDNRRFNVTPDIISSYFWDKMLFVFNKYYGTCEEEHLKARILASLSTFKNHLLRTAYGEGAEYHRNLYQLEDLFDNDKELEDFPYIVDSPNGINFYNRYVPERNKIIFDLKHAGFVIDEVKEEEIPNGHGDRNLVFVCRKVNDVEDLEKNFS